MKICPMPAELFNADRHADKHEGKSRFSNFLEHA
jgi:hypothetical protein